MSLNKPKLPKGFKTRRHTNNSGRMQIKNDKTADQVQAMARRMGVKYVWRRSQIDEMS